MTSVLTFILRLLVLAAALIFTASLLAAMLVLLALWCVSALWRKLTGRPVMPFVMRVHPRTGFERVFRPAQRVAPAQAPAKRHKLDDVTDVEPKR